MKYLNQYVTEKLIINNDSAKDIDVVFKNTYLTIVDKLIEENIHLTGSNFRRVLSDVSTQNLRLSFQKPEDEDDILDNGVYLIFQIDLRKNTIELKQSGHIWLTEEDQKKSYLCMTGIKNLYKYKKLPYFRKSRFKTAEDCANKLIKFYKQTKDILDEVTEGYPYKRMKINIY